MTDFQAVPIPPTTPLLTMCAIAVQQARFLIRLTEAFRRIIAHYVAMLWLHTYSWLGVR